MAYHNVEIQYKSRVVFTSAGGTVTCSVQKRWFRKQYRVFVEIGHGVRVPYQWVNKETAQTTCECIADDIDRWLQNDCRDVLVLNTWEDEAE